MYRYLDDILLLAPNEAFLQQLTTDVIVFLTQQGLLISPKSSIKPARQITWLGKALNFTTSSITPTPQARNRLFALAILLPLLPLHKKLLQRITGVLLWSGRPIKGTTIFLAPCYNRIYPPPKLKRPRFFGFAPNTTCRGILDLAAFSSIGWDANHSNRISPSNNWFFVDAAQHGTIFHIGIFHPSQGIQIHVAPPAIQNQQMAELFGLVYVVHLATSLRLSELHLVNDNKGALLSFSTLQPRSHNYTQVRLLRKTFNLLWWSHLKVYLYWVPSFLNPADHPSRLFSFPNAAPSQAFCMASYTYQQLQTQHDLPALLGVIQT